jgi:L-lysine 6-transaminase
MNFPGSSSAAILDDFKGLGIVEPRPFVIDLERSHGMYLVTVDGQEVFDWAGYYGAKLLGHNHPGYFEAEYVTKLVTAANNKVANPDFVTTYLVDYYKFLHRIAPKCIANPNMRVYTVNSGAEAVENALKYCVNRYYRRSEHPSEGGPIFLAFEGGFHGRTVYALSVTDMPHNPLATRDYHGLTRGQLKARYPSWDTDKGGLTNRDEVDLALARVEDILRCNSTQLAGIIVEPMQGAGGHRVAMPRFFQGLSRLAHQYDVPLIFDEVQTAGGQTGTFWLCDQFKLPYPPECVVSAKKTGCGVVYMRNQIPDAGVLDSTWSGHIVDMVRVPHEFAIIEREGLIEAVPKKAWALSKGLRKLRAAYPSLISNVRGIGLYQGFTVASPGAKARLISRALQEESLLLLGAGLDSIRFRPSLSVTLEDIENMLGKLNRLLAT